MHQSPAPSRSDSQNAHLAEVQRLLAQFDELEAEVQRIRQELSHSHRLATLGTLTSTIAHEYNNILTPVISYAQFALANPDDPELMRKAVEKALSGAQRAAQISSSLLGFARDEQPDAPATLPDVVDEALACLGRPLDKDGIQLSVDVPHVHLAISPLNLQQVLLNLILNARKAMRRTGGSLTIRATVAGDTCRIDVADTGPGIPEQLKPRLFEPFATLEHAPPTTAPPQSAAVGEHADLQSPSFPQTTQQHGHVEAALSPDHPHGDASNTEQPENHGTAGNPGTGLGLCICRDIVRQADGQIDVTSTPGHGATFHLHIPLTDEGEFLST